MQRPKQRTFARPIVAAQGDAEGELTLGVLYHNGEGVVEDRRQAAGWYARAAAQGSHEARLLLRALKAAGIKEAIAALERLGLGGSNEAGGGDAGGAGEKRY